MIPKIIHYCWIGNKPLSPLAQKCIDSWHKFMPDYEIKLWNETNYDFQKNIFMRKAYQQKQWGFVPDYARLDIIYSYGGIYLDTDVEVLKPFDELLQYPAFCGFESEYYINLGQGFGAEKGNPVIKNLMFPYEELSKMVEPKDIISFESPIYVSKYGKEEFTPSPSIQTHSLVQNYGLHLNNTRQTLRGIEVFPTSYFCPKNFITGHLDCTTDTFSIHHFMASWLPWTTLLRLKFRHILTRFFPNIANKLFLIWRKLK